MIKNAFHYVTRKRLKSIIILLYPSRSARLVLIVLLLFSRLKPPQLMQQRSQDRDCVARFCLSGRRSAVLGQQLQLLFQCGDRFFLELIHPAHPLPDPESSRSQP